VFPLQQDVRPALLHTLHKSINKGVILLATNALVSPSDVDGALQPLLIVCAYVEQYREAVFRMNTAKRGIEGHFPDWDAHPSRALIVESKNALAIAQHNALHLVKARVAQDLVDAMPIGFLQISLKRWQPSPTVGVYTSGNMCSTSRSKKA